MTSNDFDRGVLLFWRANSQCDGERRFVVTSQASTGKPSLLRSYHHPESPSPAVDCKIWEAARATAARSTVFERFGVEAKTSIAELGPPTSHNPVNNVYDEARILWPGRETTLVSIGGGTAPRNKFSGRLGASIEAVARISADAEDIARAFELQPTRSSVKTSLHRFSADNLAEIGLEEHDAVADVEAATRSYLERMEMQDRLGHCAAELAKINYKSTLRFSVLIEFANLTLLQRYPTLLRS